MSRNNKDNDKYKDIITTCNNLKNKCGQMMNDDDICFTVDMLKRFPQIDGYIGIAEQDAEIFIKKYKNILFKYENDNKIKQILPSIVSNSREIVSVPEIVIHPLRFKSDDCYLITERFYNTERLVKFCINNRAQYNFFPLLYFSNNGIYTFTDLKNFDILNEIINKNVKGLPKLYEYIDNTLKDMFNAGYKINNILFRILLDKRTGFYRIFINNTRNTRNTHKKIFRNFKDDTFKGYINSYIIKKNDPVINTILSSYNNYLHNYTTNLINDLATNGYSVKKKLVLDRGNTHNFIYKYYIDQVFDRPDLKEYQNIRKRRRNITNKKNSNYFNTILKFNGFNLNDFDDISSIDSITN